MKRYLHPRCPECGGPLEKRGRCMFLYSDGCVGFNWRQLLRERAAQ